MGRLNTAEAVGGRRLRTHRHRGGGHRRHESVRRVGFGCGHDDRRDPDRRDGQRPRADERVILHPTGDHRPDDRRGRRLRSLRRFAKRIRPPSSGPHSRGFIARGPESDLRRRAARRRTGAAARHGCARKRATKLRADRCPHPPIPIPSALLRDGAIGWRTGDRSRPLRVRRPRIACACDERK